MPNPPIYDESVNSNANRMVGALASVPRERPVADIELEIGRPGRRLFLYPARMGYDLQEELQFLTNRAMEPNIFFAAGFLAPAMPRLEDRQVRLALIRDDRNNRSRMRMLMPFSVEKPGFSVGPSIIRAWSNPFGPLGTPLIDAEEAAETIENMLEAYALPASKLPGVLVLPDLRLNGIVAQMIRALAISRDLPLTLTNTYQRPMLNSDEDGETYLAGSLSKHHLREMRRQWRLLAKDGGLSYNVARQPEDIRVRMEEFLALEASGWKGKKRSAMVMDRYRAAFAREAITNLADIDAVRIHTLDLNGQAIASMVVFIMGGEAYTWKTAYDESYARFSPGKLLMVELTKWHLDDANIERTDSCAVPDHPIMSRFWREREEMGTLVIGLARNSDRDVRQAANQLHLYRNTRNMARILRDKILARRNDD
ncbi:GNAT family N-acetyltransferase [Ciceribacter sp. L1K23]|uniref:GNAT family N-acetyltransferase n=1 Tax=unclassified Ciceribacter TaxID=2628820 RepID=UPI001ABE97C6|nr:MULTISPECIES: GNAT family N-acetyltransferase [unclassified Ciceribacter]MBO3762368.1 GNAT family N-acetyltransferase [Ciceribacter sp. L1K22]MBR0554275.1 GNAT family N-acetyltransferase [Ciceribacter sp. L1K23]